MRLYIDTDANVLVHRVLKYDEDLNMTRVGFAIRDDLNEVTNIFFMSDDSTISSWEEHWIEL